MNVGLSCWNRWGDAVLDRPDNSDEPIVANIVNELAPKDHVIYGLQVLDDTEPVFFGENAKQRETAFTLMRHTLELPELDVLFLRWRWDMPGRENLVIRQTQVLDRYLKTNTRIIVWDDDFQLFHTPTAASTLRRLADARNVELIEISDAAKEQAAHAGCKFTAVPYPLDIDVDAALSRVCVPSRYDRLSYVGNRYERDDIIDEWVTHETSRHPRQTHFYGNWMKRGGPERWPDIEFHPKVARIGRDDAYRRSVAVPMLAKQVYLDRGHVVPRLHEVVHAGGIPIGLSSFRNTSRYFSLVADDGRHLSALVDEIASWSLQQRRDALVRQCDLMRPEFDTKIFIERLGL